MTQMAKRDFGIVTHRKHCSVCKKRMKHLTAFGRCRRCKARLVVKG
jgi:hypothetical protein